MAAKKDVQRAEKSDKNDDRLNKKKNKNATPKIKKCITNHAELLKAAKVVGKNILDKGAQACTDNEEILSIIKKPGKGK